MKEGILIINKPQGLTSHDVVNSVRKKLGIRRVGHAGTLDPFATGVLVILIGRFTKLFNQLLGCDKEYIATLTLGTQTATGDITGKVIQERKPSGITQEKVKVVLSSCVGERLQVPPMFSALKFKGNPLYRLARQGIDVERKPRKITIKEARLLNLTSKDIRFYLRCSSGTYVRKLAEEIAADLGCVGYLSQLERYSVGPFRIEQAIGLSQIDELAIIETLPQLY